MKPAPLKETRLLLNLYPVNSVRLNRIEHLLKMEGKTRTWWINAAVREKLDRDHPETNCPESEYKPAPIPLDNPAALGFHDYSLRKLEHMTKILGSFAPAAPLNGAVPLDKKWQSLSDSEKEAVAEAAERLAAVHSPKPPALEDTNPEQYAQQREKRRRDAERFFRDSLQASMKELRDTLKTSPGDQELISFLQTVMEAQKALESPLAETPQIQALAKYWRDIEEIGMEDSLELAAIAKGQEMTEAEKKQIMERHHAAMLAQVSDVDADFWGDDDFSKGRELIKRHTR